MKAFVTAFIAITFFLTIAFFVSGGVAVYYAMNNPESIGSFFGRIGSGFKAEEIK